MVVTSYVSKNIFTLTKFLRTFSSKSTESLLKPSEKAVKYLWADRLELLLMETNKGHMDSCNDQALFDIEREYSLNSLRCGQKCFLGKNCLLALCSQRIRCPRSRISCYWSVEMIPQNDALFCIRKLLREMSELTQTHVLNTKCALQIPMHRSLEYRYVSIFFKSFSFGQPGLIQLYVVCLICFIFTYVSLTLYLHQIA